MRDKTFLDQLKAQGLDPARVLARADVAEASLESEVQAQSYKAAKPAKVAAPKGALLDAPHGARQTEVLYGEELAVLAIENGFAFCQLKTDQYVGYLPVSAVEFGGTLVASHSVSVPATFLYPRPDIKTGPLETLYMGSFVNAQPCDDQRFLQVPALNGYLWKSHLTEKGSYEADFVSVAERFLHVPYLWGGRSAHGLDCSALIQLSLLRAGISSPRDTYQMWADLGDLLSEDDDLPQGLKRGDLIFWPGHVGVLQSPTQLLHSNGYHMQTRSEPLEEAVKRIAEHYGKVRGVKRIKDVL